MVARSEQFADILDVRFLRIKDERFDQLPDIVVKYFGMEEGSKPGRQQEQFSTIGTLGDIPQSNVVVYDDVYQGYRTVMTPLEFSSGFQIERRLFDDAHFGIIDRKPNALFGAAHRTRQSYAARIFEQAFSVDTFFYENSEGVALCSGSHTTTSGASTAVGFNNLITTAFSATALATARSTMINFRGDRAEKIPVKPDMIVFPAQGALYETVYEAIGSPGKPGVATNERNVHYGQYEVSEEIWLTDANNWFLCDSDMMKEYARWIDRVKLEFGFVEDFDTYTAKWRIYFRLGYCWYDWRWALGANVS